MNRNLLFCDDTQAHYFFIFEQLYVNKECFKTHIKEKKIKKSLIGFYK